MPGRYASVRAAPLSVCDPPKVMPAACETVPPRLSAVMPANALEPTLTAMPAAPVAIDATLPAA